MKTYREIFDELSLALAELPGELPEEMPSFLLMPADLVVEHSASKIGMPTINRALQMKWKRASRVQCAAAAGIGRDTLAVWLVRGELDEAESYSHFAARFRVCEVRAMAHFEAKLEELGTFNAVMYQLQLLGYPAPAQAQKIEAKVETSSVKSHRVDVESMSDEELRDFLREKARDA